MDAAESRQHASHLPAGKTIEVERHRGNGPAERGMIALVFADPKDLRTQPPQIISAIGIMMANRQAVQSSRRPGLAQPAYPQRGHGRQGQRPAQIKQIAKEGKIVARVSGPFLKAARIKKMTQA